MAVKLIVITDAHANLPALTAALDAATREGYDLVVHTGDAIAIGPQPDEVLDRLLRTPNLLCVMGNHDAWFVDGLPDPPPRVMAAGEIAHQHWTHRALDPALRPVVAAWPYRLTRDLDGVPVTFIHYGLRENGRDFVPVVGEPGAADLDRVFASETGALIFYGHHHPQSDIQGRARYINPGSLGCATTAVARYVVAECHAGQVHIEHRAVPYDDTPLYEAFEQRQVPERAAIYRMFFGGRFPPDR